MSWNFPAASNSRLEYNGAVSTTLPLTMACFISQSGGEVSTPALIALSATGSSFIDGWRLSLDPGGTYVFARAETGFSTGTSITTNKISGVDGSWHSAAGVFKSTTSRTAYLDGIPAVENTTSIVPSGVNKTTIAAQYEGASLGYFYQGLIFRACIWQAELTPSEILDFHFGKLPNQIRPGTLLTWVCEDTNIDLALGNLYLPTFSWHSKSMPRRMRLDSKGGFSVPARIATATRTRVVNVM